MRSSRFLSICRAFRLANLDSIAITAFLREEDVRDYVIHGGEGLEAAS